MKAVLLDRPGPPSSLRIGEIATPRARAGEALVRVFATSLNPVDYKVGAQGYNNFVVPQWGEARNVAFKQRLMPTTP
jgi:NADPH:quinone reductase